MISVSSPTQRDVISRPSHHGVVGEVSSSLWGQDGGPRHLPKPSHREQEVLSLVAEGYSNKLIAARLIISERTVKSHMTNVMTKLQAYDRTHAVVEAIRNGWLSI